MKRYDWYRVGQFLSVFMGGMIGGVGRYEVGIWLNDGHSLLATTTVNLVGCFLLVFTIYGLDLHFAFPEWIILGLGTGIIGAFTTFSTFTVQFVQTIQTDSLTAIGFLAANLFGGMLMAILGFGAVQLIKWRVRE
ncbi:fluoride efflux transporter FluC [Lentilactobacillus kisonensis]|nr:CrcB family protein [Lentilactobacillus kisonensis]